MWIFRNGEGGLKQVRNDNSKRCPSETRPKFKSIYISLEYKEIVCGLNLKTVAPKSSSSASNLSSIRASYKKLQFCFIEWWQCRPRRAIGSRREP